MAGRHYLARRQRKLDKLSVLGFSHDESEVWLNQEPNYGRYIFRQVLSDDFFHDDDPTKTTQNCPAKDFKASSFAVMVTKSTRQRRD